MQLIDLQAQYRRIKDEVDAGIHRVLDHGKYVMGPEVETLEQRLADHARERREAAIAAGFS